MAENSPLSLRRSAALILPLTLLAAPVFAQTGVKEDSVVLQPDKVTDDASFFDDLGADSLDVVELVMAFEEEFGVEIPEDDADKIKTVKDAIAYIDSQKG